MKEKLNYIVQYYGVNKQNKKLNEEAWELNEAITQFEAKPDRYTKEHIVEEFADVMVILSQIFVHYDLSILDIFDVMNAKVNRQLKRITKEIHEKGVRTIETDGNGLANHIDSSVTSNRANFDDFINKKDGQKN